MNGNKSKVLLLGWDAADWQIINNLIDRGEMPALKSLIEEGVMGNISTLEPAYSPMLWTTIATGKYPDKHGILGFAEPTPDHSGIRPVSNSSRKVKAIWNILTQKGYKTHVVNWWPSYPAEPVNGIYISNLFPKIKPQHKPGDYLLPDDTVYPPELQPLFAHFRIHPLELSLAQIHPFIPEADPARLSLTKRLATIAQILAEAASVQAAATLALEQESWDFAAIYWDTIDHICHRFMNYSPPKMDGISDDDYVLYRHVVDGAYKLMDLMLGRLLQLAGPDCTVILLSDHGFKSGRLRQKQTPNEPAGPAFHHREVGIFCAKGPHIKKDEIVYGASLLDITPTILYLLGLPVGEDMDGRPLTEIFSRQTPIETIPSWEDLQGECGMLPEEKRDLNPEHSAEAIRQLIDLGYIDDPGENQKIAVERTIDELNYNLARVYCGTDRYVLAKPLLEKLFEKKPHQGRIAFRLIDCYLNEGNPDLAEQFLERLKIEASKKILTNDQIETIKRRKIPEILNGSEVENWIREFKRTPLKEHQQARIDLTEASIYEGDVLFARGYSRKALKKYKSIPEGKIKSQAYYARMGKAYLKTKEWKEAKKMYEILAGLNPDSASAHQGLGICEYNLKQPRLALGHLLDSVTLDFYNFNTHFQIGRALIETGDLTGAVQALETSIKINPNFGLARNLLITILETKLNDKEKAEQYKTGTNFSRGNRLNSNPEKGEPIIIQRKTVSDQMPIIVVSGLPRSGTSLMMQMLEAGGVSLFTDHLRQPDQNNPKGYFEHEKVKQLARNHHWLGEATGKAVKVIVPLLYKLPAAFTYKVIFMSRDIHEISESQHQMLVANQKAKSSDYPAGLEETYLQFLNRLEGWIKRNNNVEVLYIEFSQAIREPEATARKVAEFIGCPEKIKEMAATVQSELYRTKIK